MRSSCRYPRDANDEVWEHLRMSSPEDPEERIRQLEQRAADGMVELGATHTPAYSDPSLPPPVYPPTPPLSGPFSDTSYANPYDNPYPPPFGTQFPEVPKKGVSFGLIFGLIFGVVILATIGGVAAVVWNVMSNTSETIRPDADRANGGSYGIPGVRIPEVPEIPAMPTIQIPEMPTVLPRVPSAPTATPGGQLSIAGVDKHETVACNDAHINVSGVNNTVELTGHCASLTVSGVNNRVTVENTDKIGASGFDNVIVYKSGEPVIEATDSNSVQPG